MQGTLGIAVLSSIGILIILIKAIGIKGLIENEIKIDIGVTIGFLWFSGGTYSGIAMAVTTGVITSAVLWTIKWIYKDEYK